MGNLNSARRKLNAKSVNFAQQVEKKKLDLAKEFVKERVQKDAEFARDVLKAVGDLLPEDIKKLAQATIKNDAKKVNEEHYKNEIELSAKAIADKVDSAFIAELPYHIEHLKDTEMLPQQECCGHDCGCHARPSDEEMIRPLGDPHRGDISLREIIKEITDQPLTIEETPIEDVPLSDGGG